MVSHLMKGWEHVRVQPESTLQLHLVLIEKVAVFTRNQSRSLAVKMKFSVKYWSQQLAVDRTDTEKGLSG